MFSLTWLKITFQIWKNKFARKDLLTMNTSNTRKACIRSMRWESDGENKFGSYKTSKMKLTNRMGEEHINAGSRVGSHFFFLSFILFKICTMMSVIAEKLLWKWKITISLFPTNHSRTYEKIITHDISWLIENNKIVLLYSI